jgi:hypothetical protein
MVTELFRKDDRSIRYGDLAIRPDTVSFLVTGRTEEALMEALAEQGISTTAPLAMLPRDVENIRREHWEIVYDFTV